MPSFLQGVGERNRVEHAKQAGDRQVSLLDLGGLSGPGSFSPVALANARRKQVAVGIADHNTRQLVAPHPRRTRPAGRG